jgi:hypothetical protein
MSCAAAVAQRGRERRSLDHLPKNWSIFARHLLDEIAIVKLALQALDVGIR